MPISVLIVDDHPSFRASARMMLEADGLEVVGEASNGRGAIDRARELRPDVALVDVQLPDMDGFAVSAALTADAPRPAVVMTSSRDASDFGSLPADNGASGFVPKSELSGAALEALLR